ncbi:glycosyltransferase family 2 protein [Variovorax sp. PCZ-1]|uniref:glycosyltransferase family 2 protein n=1 Tax=Variovorax sp. PCZ-1 TaxID=2835533 RepID=UPI001BCE841E|nr:glycosyltransferase family 2 protein [Variovorax sp. PCZ-1]MBS7808763.1 glycosyltransferase family 2 protein [Variovorax sp. PCZ-1]
MAEQAYTLDDVTIIIVTYNSAHCIPALASDLQGFAKVFISDNASEDGTCDAAAHLMPQARILAHSSNLGFGAANNRALAQVQTRFALLLNPDCQMSRDAALALLKVSEAYPEAAVVAPQLLRANGSQEISYRWPSTHWASSGVGAESECCVGFVCGAAMLINMAQAKPVGFFDEDFFLYYEDEDLCLRLFQAQRSIILAPHVQLTHSSRGSVRGKYPLRAEYGRGYHHAQSKILFAWKHHSENIAQSLMWRTWAFAALGLPFRLLLPAPRLVARWCGRMRGAWAMRERLAAPPARGKL